MDSVQYLRSRGYSDLQIECIRYTLRYSRENGCDAETFDGNVHQVEICCNKGITTWAPEENPCSSARQYSAVMRSIAKKAREDKEPTLYYWTSTPEERKSYKQMRFPSRCWEGWRIEVDLARGLR